MTETELTDTFLPKKIVADIQFATNVASVRPLKILSLISGRSDDFCQLCFKDI
jgi:hypothetical protein